MRTLLHLTPALFLLMAGSCTGQPSSRDLNVEEFGRALLADHVQLVDVRTPGEYAAGHLKGAKLMDWNGGQFQKEMTKLDKDKPVLLYCGSGRRSDAALQELEKAGYRDVKHLVGGIQAWTQGGRPVAR
ncbi:MAG: rhodanese-like domain-containing protein [Flavobacteriales bacterium]|nr:rhodanese-like domain-containing protein [Flavobacteriales bacterium]